VAVLKGERERAGGGAVTTIWVRGGSTGAADFWGGSRDQKGGLRIGIVRKRKIKVEHGYAKVESISQMERRSIKGRPSQ